MTIAVNHAFVSLKGDGTDATQVQPSNWNAAHALTLATGNIIGRLSAGAGVAEEIPISAYMAGLLATADAPTLAGILGLFDTGDVKYSFKTSAPAGWLLLNSNNNAIGNASSGASLRANADTFNLFALIYASCADAIAPVSGGRGASATADFNANKTISIPQLVGKSPIGAGTASGFTTRAIGTNYGAETHVLTSAEMPSHFHAASIFDPSHTHGVSGGVWGGTALHAISFNDVSGLYAPAAIVINAAVTGVRVNSSNGLDTTYSAGSGGAHSILGPVMGMSVLVKL